MKTEKYRIEGHSLYEFDEKSNAYIHVYKDSRLTGQKLVDCYEKLELEDDQD